LQKNRTKLFFSSIKLVNKIKYIISKLQIKSLKYEFLIIPVLIFWTVFLARWNLFFASGFLGSTTQKKLKKVKVGLLEKDVLELHVHGEQFKRKWQKMRWVSGKRRKGQIDGVRVLYLENESCLILSWSNCLLPCEVIWFSFVFVFFARYTCTN